MSESVSSYWLRPPADENGPARYARLDRAQRRRSRSLARMLRSLYPDRDGSVLELGCNVGRNLEFLRLEGFRDLRGVDVNPEVRAVGSARWPELWRDLWFLEGELRDVVESLPDRSVDVVFSMACLEHVPLAECPYEGMRRVARRHIVTIEDERRSGPLHFPRCHSSYLERDEWAQEAVAYRWPGLPDGFVARVFVRRGVEDGS